MKDSAFKIGDRVKFKVSSQVDVLGYVSHIHKGYLFYLEDFDVHVHLGNKQHMIVKESEIELCNTIKKKSKNE